MFVTMMTYRARAGEEDAIVALHEDWQRRRCACLHGYVSGELLNDLRDPQGFVDIARYENEDAARASGADPEQTAWYARLASLAETEPVTAQYHTAWQVD